MNETDTFHESIIIIKNFITAQIIIMIDTYDSMIGGNRSARMERETRISACSQSYYFRIFVCRQIFCTPARKVKYAPKTFS